MATQSSSVKLTVKSIVRGYHVFKEVWDPRRGDQFCLQIEEFNRYDRYAVAIVVDEKNCQTCAKLFYYFLKGNGTICGEVMKVCGLNWLKASQTSWPLCCHCVPQMLLPRERRQRAEIRRF